MKFEAIPIISLELEHMKHSIVTALGLRGSELGEAIGASIDAAIKSYDFDGKVSAIAHDVITCEIEAFFRYGQGHDCIKAAVQEALVSFTNQSVQPIENGG